MRKLHNVDAIIIYAVWHDLCVCVCIYSFKKLSIQRERERDTRGAVLVCALFSKSKGDIQTQKFLIRLIQYTYMLFTFCWFNAYCSAV